MSELTFILTCSNYNSGQPVTLTVSPDGWDQSMITWERSKKFWGVFRSWSIPLKFVKEGAEMLRWEFYTRGLAGVATLEIQRKNMITMVSTTAYTGAVDFTTFRDSEDAVDVNLLDSGIIKEIKDNLSTDYTFDGTDDYLGGATNTETFSNGYINLGAGYYDCWDLQNLAKALIDKMTAGKLTDGTIGFQSDILSFYSIADYDPGVNLYPVCFTTGLALRYGSGFGNPMRITTSFESFFQSIESLFGVGMGIEIIDDKEVIRIEDRSYFFDDDSTIIDVGEAVTVDISPEKDLTAGRVISGYDAMDYDDTAANPEINGTSKWRLPVESSNNEINLISKYRGDYRGIEETIQQSTSGNDTTDNDIFLVELLLYPGTPNPDYWTMLTGSQARLTTSPGTTWSIRNAGISPRQLYLANKNYINSIIWNYSGVSVQFTSGDNELNNVEINKYGSGVWVKEYDSHTITNPVYFLPIVFEIECALPRQIIDELNDNSIRRLQFTWKGNTYTGWVMEVKATLPGRSSAKIKLLACWGNYMTNLIR